ncbi:MAG: hypothetical protein Q8L14_34605 [Myxococcales bacterium]|nr:hypothetical protein [Myxococcales bacterium]
MVPILGIAAFVLWLYGLNVRPGDGRVHLLVLGAALALVFQVIQHRRELRRLSGRRVVPTQSPRSSS